MKVYFYTLGCKVNSYETQVMSELIKAAGYEITSSCDEADIIIVNSCTVTAFADKKTRQAVRRFKRSNPGCITVLTGCMPQAYPDDARELSEADIVIGNRSNHEIAEILNEYFDKKERLILTKPHENGDPFIPCRVTDFSERTRADVKIQDGCNRFCTYCIIPKSRGRVRSKPLADIKKELETLSANGYIEAVLVGINLSSYGQDIGCSFPEAVELACGIPGIERVRLGSLEPDHLTSEVINRLSKCERLCPQFHISLQSGCNKTLKNMHRHYTAQEYLSLCDNLRKSFKDCTLTTDIMVGFPGETEDDFIESLDFVKRVGFEKVHVFPYSRRPGTPAAKYELQIPNAVKEKRAAEMLREAAKIRKSFLMSQKGKTVTVLFEGKTRDGLLSGYTPNYTPVRVDYSGEIANTVRQVKITGAVNDEYCTGELI